MLVACLSSTRTILTRPISHCISITTARQATTMAQHTPNESTQSELRDVATRIRIESIRMTTAAKSGHPTSSTSMAELAAVLFCHTMKYDPSEPRNPNADRFVLSKGHACPALYAAWAQVGYLKHDDLLTLRKIDSLIEGHPTPRLDFIDVASGSLGQGLGNAAGMAYLGKYIEKAPYRVFCMMGDGECAEGSVWEAMHFAGIYQLDNLIGIVDVNRIGQSGPTSLQHQMGVYKARVEAFGWEAVVVDGHDIAQVAEALSRARNEPPKSKKPTMILAKTFKGRGIPGIEDELNWHGKAIPADRAASTIQALTAELRDPESVGKASTLRPSMPSSGALQPIDKLPKVQLADSPAYDKSKPIATRFAYGTALVKLATKCDRIVALDAEVKGSTFASKLSDIYPARFIECYIAEQNMVSVATGMGTRKRAIPFVSTFAAFFSRAYDQIRMGAISMANVKFVGSHVGVSIGEDGGSQMGLEDLAMFRAIPGALVFYPSDAVSCERACELAANYDGIVYIRTSRPATPILYEANESFAAGQSKVIRKASGSARATIVAAGVTLPEALKAADQLAADGIEVNVVDMFSVKPVDRETLVQAARTSGNRIITVEDHYMEGGVGEAVSGALSDVEPAIRVDRLGVDRLPRSGAPQELVDMFGIGAGSIVAAVKAI